MASYVDAAIKEEELVSGTASLRSTCLVNLAKVLKRCVSFTYLLYVPLSPRGSISIRAKVSMGGKASFVGNTAVANNGGEKHCSREQPHHR